VNSTLKPKAEGECLLELVCERDLEGVVAKHRLSRYTIEDGNPAWVKIRNRKHFAVDRQE
jgi:ATP-dependent DNA ligase